MEWWWNKPTWDALFRGALFKQDYATALSIARDRIRRGDARNAEGILNTGACHSYQENAAATEYYRAIEAEIHAAFPNNEPLRLLALNDVALSLGIEGIPISEDVVAGWEGIGTPRDTLDAWPKQEEAANVARGRLALLYTKAGQAEAAAKVFPFELCRHLRPVKDHLTLQDVKGTFLLNDRMQLVYSVSVVLDLDAIARSVKLPPEVHPVDYFDRKAAYDDLGFECGVHSMWILGIHYQS